MRSSKTHSETPCRMLLLALLLVVSVPQQVWSAENHTRFYVVAINWEAIQMPFGVALWLLLATLVKIGTDTFIPQSIQFRSLSHNRSELVSMCRIPPLGEVHAVRALQRHGDPTRPHYGWTSHPVRRARQPKCAFSDQNVANVVAAESQLQCTVP